PKRGTGWDADTLAGTTTVAPAANPGRPASAAGNGGLYRSSGSFEPAGSYDPEPTPPPAPPAETGSTPRPMGLGAALMGQPEDPHESWLRDLGPSGRHAASD